MGSEFDGADRCASPGPGGLAARGSPAARAASLAEAGPSPARTRGSAVARRRAAGGEPDAELAANRGVRAVPGDGRLRTAAGWRAAEAVDAPELPDGVVNVADPDSEWMKAHPGSCRATTRRRSSTEGQIVLAAEITITAADFGRLDPMITATLRELERGCQRAPEVRSPTPATGTSSTWTR